MTEALPPGSTIGILGGGQLGRMLAIAAARLGFRSHIFEPSPNPPAGDVAYAVTTAAYDDVRAVEAFARSVDVVTFEFENVPSGLATKLGEHAPVRPNAKAFEVAQDRIWEKRFLNDCGIATAPWAEVNSIEGLVTAIDRIGTPSILKTRRMGYDGKGQARLSSADDSKTAWERVGSTPSVLEGMVSFDREVSVIAARGLSGEVVCYDPGENVHLGGILHTTTIPAQVSTSLRQDAILTAGRVLNALDYVGVMGIEMFVMGRDLLVNEIAPRVHNSGHWTIEACVIDQFQQHIRAVSGWPLGDGARHSDAVMTNLIGQDAAGWAGLAGRNDGLHLYGKSEIRDGRKMGHVTHLTPKAS